MLAVPTDGTPLSSGVWGIALTNLYNQLTEGDFEMLGSLTIDNDLTVAGLFSAPLTNGWTSFPPTWTASSVNPAIGNGTIEGWYARSNKLVAYTGRILMGSTTTFGTGTYNVTAPVAPRDTNLYAGAGLVFDSSSATGRAPMTTMLDSATRLRFFGGVPAAGQIGTTAPFTWAQSDQLVWSILYEAA